MSPDRFRALAEQAFADADAYRADAGFSSGDRRALLLKWADQREDDAHFYQFKAASDEAFEAMRSKLKQKEAA